MPQKNRRKTPTRKPNGPFNVGAAIDPFAVNNSAVVRKYYPYESGNTNLNHNTPVQATNGITGIVPGNTYLTRVGNFIKLDTLNLRFWLSNKSDRPNVMYRICVNAVSTGVNADTFAEQFPICSSFNNILSMPDPGRTLSLYDHVVNATGPNGPIVGSSALVPTKERSYYHSISLPIKRIVSWGTDGNPNVAIYVWVVAYDAFGTLTTDTIASYAVASEMIFQDLD